ncbi:lipopolysaccharide biosynthesis protein [Natrinema ejinorense]|uniref:Uncharacterized protein n=1 Tax=Natrinema ejinorense TaxID=373386 RepID=A0A2A5QUH0_9EURY|nr:lipopolysaccharide biosynthesis protein [Natrinema ejinorense]PCR90472.1 hypothetical protein CP557_08000 [Natrinema ejinorense]
MTTFTEKLSKDVLGYLPAKVIPAVTQFATVLVFTTLLTPSQYGDYTVVLTTVSFVIIFLSSWLRQSILRYFEQSSNENSIRPLLSTLLNAYFLIYIVLFVIWVGGLLVLDRHFTTRLVLPLFLGVFIVGGNGLFMLLTAIRRVENNIIRYSTFTCLNTVLQLLVGAALIYYTPFDVVGALIGMILVTGLLSAIELRHLYKLGNYSPKYFSFKKLKQSYEFGVPFIGSQLSGKVLELADNYLIFFFLGSVTVGKYAAGYSIFYRIIFFIFSLLSLAAYPEVVKTFENNGSEAASESISVTVRAYLLIAFPAAFGLIAIGPELVQTVLDSEYSGSTVIIPWVVLGTFFYGLGQLSTYPIQLMEKTRWLPIILSVAAVSNLLLNVLLIPYHGIAGAAIATLISYLLYFILTTFISNKIMVWEYPYYLSIKCLLASMIVWLSVSYLSVHFRGLIFLTVALPSGIVLYAVLLLVLRVNEFEQIISRSRQEIGLLTESADSNDLD